MMPKQQEQKSNGFPKTSEESSKRLKKSSSWGLLLLMLLSLANLTPSINCAKLHTNVIDFAAQFFRESRNYQKNMVIAPLAMHNSLTILLTGIEKPCFARDHLAKLLGYSNVDDDLPSAHKNYRKLIQELKEFEQDDELRVKIDTKLILGDDTEVERHFNKKVTKYFDVEEHRFAKRKRNDIKKFVKKVNKEAEDFGFKYPVLDEDEMVRSDDGLFILSTVFFSSGWEEVKFDDTDAAYFYNEGTDKVRITALKAKKDTQVKMLQFSSRDTDSCKKCKHATKPFHGIPDFRMIQIKLKDKFTYTIIEPVDRNGYALNLVENELLRCLNKGGFLAQALEKLDESDEMEIDYLVMPAFRIEQNTNVKKILVEKFNLRSLTEGTQIDGLVEDKKQNLMSCESGAVICVDKTGVEAGSHAQLGSKGRDCKVKIENPFMFIVRYEEIPIYMGHVVQIQDEMLSN